jgi:inner membrane transporter RhtA
VNVEHSGAPSNCLDILNNIHQKGSLEYQPRRVDAVAMNTAATAAPARGASSAPATAVAMVIGSCISLQVGAALASRLFEVAGASATTLLRLTMAAAVLILTVRPAVRGWTASQWRHVALLGVCMAGMNGFFYASIARIPLGAAVTIEFLGPLALAAVLTRRGRDWLWVLLAVGGVAMLGLGEVGGTALDTTGVVFSAVAGIFWALYIVTATAVGKALPGRDGLAVAVGVGAMLLLPLGAAGTTAVLASPGAIALALATGVLASVIPYSQEIAALRRIPTSTFGILLSIEPAIAAVAGWLLLSQHMGLPGIVGVLVVVAASIGSTVSAAAGAVDTSTPEPAHPEATHDQGLLIPASVGGL